MWPLRPWLGCSSSSVAVDGKDKERKNVSCMLQGEETTKERKKKESLVIIPDSGIKPPHLLNGGDVNYGEMFGQSDYLNAFTEEEAANEPLVPLLLFCLNCVREKRLTCHVALMPYLAPITGLEGEILRNSVLIHHVLPEAVNSAYRF